MLARIHDPPAQHGLRRSRWTLDLLRTHCEPLQRVRSRSGVWRRLHQWRLAWRRGRWHVTSPDPDYAVKVARVQAWCQAAHTDPAGVSVLFVDEYTCYRQPALGAAWHTRGGGGAGQKRARRSCTANTKYRFAAALDVVTGRVVYRGNSRIGVWQLCAFLKQLRRAYGPTRQLVVIWDNWPMHGYDHVRETARAERIELVFLPVYAPWTNPIEKLWRKLKEELLVLHTASERWRELVQQVRTFLAEYDRPAPDLLRYVGLAREQLPE